MEGRTCPCAPSLCGARAHCPDPRSPARAPPPSTAASLSGSARVPSARDTCQLVRGEEGDNCQLVRSEQGLSQVLDPGCRAQGPLQQVRLQLTCSIFASFVDVPLARVSCSAGACKQDNGA